MTALLQLACQPGNHGIHAGNNIRPGAAFQGAGEFRELGLFRKFWWVVQIVQIVQARASMMTIDGFGSNPLNY